MRIKSKFYIFPAILFLLMGCVEPKSAPTDTSVPEVGINGEDGGDGGEGGNAGIVVIHAATILSSPALEAKGGSGGTGGRGGQGQMAKHPGKPGTPGKSGRGGSAGQAQMLEVTPANNFSNAWTETLTILEGETVSLKGAHDFQTIVVSGTLKAEGEAFFNCDRLTVTETGKIDFGGTADHPDGFYLGIQCRELIIDGEISASGYQSSIPGENGGDGGMVEIAVLKSLSGEGVIRVNGGTGTSGEDGRAGAQ